MTRPTVLTLEDATAQAAAFIEARRALHGSLRMDAADDGGTDNAGTDGGKDDGSTEPPAKSVEEQLAEALAAVDEWKGHARKHESTAKARKAAADELAALKAANATPDEKLTAAQREAAEARAELAKYRVAAETGIPADLIFGEDEDAMRAYADRLKAFRGEAPTKTPPKPDPSQGPKGEANKRTAAEIAKADYQRRHPTKN